MALPDFSMRQLLEAGVHFGHQSHRWNPKMADYIFGARNNIHIIDLAQTVPMLHRALQAISDTVAKGGRVLFVGTVTMPGSIMHQLVKHAQGVETASWIKDEGVNATHLDAIQVDDQGQRSEDDLLQGERDTRNEVLAPGRGGRLSATLRF